MKKLLALIMILSVTSSASYASSFWKDVKNSFKRDVNATKQAIKTDINNTKREQAAEKAAKKKESIKQVNDRITELNKEMRQVKADKNITETERTIKVKLLQKQIDFYKKEKQDIQKW